MTKPKPTTEKIDVDFKKTAKLRSKEVFHTSDEGDKRTSYSKHLQEFEGKIVEVKDLFGEKIRGKCIAVNKSHLNVILENDEGTIIIKNINSIRMEK